MPMPERVAFIGLGNMGTPMSHRLIDGGFDVVGFDLNEAALARLAADGGTVRPSAAEAARGADIVILMLPNSAIVDATIGELVEAEALGGRAVLVDMSSSDPIATQANADILSARDIPFLDAPVSGGVRGAQAGSLMIMVGGDPVVLESVAPILTRLGNPVHVGPIGAGHAAKALNNLVSAAHLWVTSEAVLAADRFGIDRERFVEVLNGSTGRSVSSEVKWPKFILPGTYDSGFGAGLLLMDLTIAVEVAERLGTPTMMSREVRERWAEAVAELGMGADHTEVARWLEQQDEDGSR
jgi:3-hydroxyisobutyrate dehydrogenase